MMCVCVPQASNWFSPTEQPPSTDFRSAGGIPKHLRLRESFTASFQCADCFCDEKHRVCLKRDSFQCLVFL